MDKDQAVLRQRIILLDGKIDGLCRMIHAICKRGDGDLDGMLKQLKEYAIEFSRLNHSLKLSDKLWAKKCSKKTESRIMSARAGRPARDIETIPGPRYQDVV